MEKTVETSYNELCLTAKQMHEDLQLSLAQLGQLILSSVTLLLLIFSVWTFKRNKFALHYNFMLLITNIIILYVLHSVTLIAIELRYQIPVIFNYDPCDLLSPTWMNVLFRLPCYVYTTAYVLFHFALTTERARATIFAKRYEREGSNYAVFSMVIVWILTAVINGFMLILAWNDPKFHKPTLHIVLTTDSNSTYLIFTHFFFVTVIIITAILDYFLLYTNRKNKSKTEDYSLSRSYQINENIIVMKLIWPLDVCFAIVFAVYLIGTGYLRFIRERITVAHFVANYEVIYMILPMHSIVVLLFYLHFVKRNKSRASSVAVEPGDPTQLHFEQLESQWTATQKRKSR
ncbi:serpentine type 7TM GPCR receptor class ab chemoreceptor domain-containing protein [Ditylenchus destructor]|uniref:Serpentine type 7TM GPCR receptor class ab chemoreceptor domain-containing protein n=1 Tax=Ditylenchus destructor TaxID=166010 RepID=A0AAD4MR33_9BILA|nr:serpentine type 7TM GPCR receptor class ab chemoreceptor domain-containing protein [Ditylenchus destructor]